MKPPKHRLSFNALFDTEFEEFTFDLLEEMGFVNLDWRKGTGKKTSPTDSGRDIVADLNRTDVDKSRSSERWFVDCKHYVKGVPAKELHNLLAWADAERPDRLSSSLPISSVIRPRITSKRTSGTIVRRSSSRLGAHQSGVHLTGET